MLKMCQIKPNDKGEKTEMTEMRDAIFLLLALAAANPDEIGYLGSICKALNENSQD